MASTDGAQPAGMTPLEEPTTQNSSFEGMFVRTLKPTGPFADDLRVAGYDIAAPKPVYPGRVWFDCLEVARRHVYPDRPAEDGMRELGRRFARGFFETLVGKMMSVGLPVLGPVPVFKRLPRYWSMTRTGVTVVCTPLGDRHWKVVFRDPYPRPEFVAGLLHEGIRRTGISPSVKIAERSDVGFELDVTW